jgi:signal transduction histidine kinase
VRFDDAATDRQAGLAICRGIIEAHGGRIWVESEGRDEERLPGSTFFIELPIEADAQAARRIIPT